MQSGGLIEACWKALGGNVCALGGLSVVDADAWLGGPLAVDDLAVGAVAAGLLAAAELAEARGLGRPGVRLCAEHVALSFRSEAHAVVSGRPAGGGFAPLSRFVRCSGGGWARTHGNYPHHAAALGRALGFDPTLEGAESAASLQRAAARLDATSLSAWGGGPWGTDHSRAVGAGVDGRCAAGGATGPRAARRCHRTCRPRPLSGGVRRRGADRPARAARRPGSGLGARAASTGR